MKVRNGIFLLAGLILFFSLGALAAAKGFLDFTYDSKGKRDPFVPLVGGELSAVAPETFAGEFRLEGIILDPREGSLAIINGKVVREGDTLVGYRVDKIKKSSVLMSKEEEVFTLSLTSKK